LKEPTVITYDDHDYVFEGFSVLYRVSLANVNDCIVVYHNIDYAIGLEEESPLEHYTIEELDLLQQYLLIDVCELYNIQWGPLNNNNDISTCTCYHFFPRFARILPDNGKELLHPAEQIQYFLKHIKPLMPNDLYSRCKSMSVDAWDKYVSKVQGSIVWFPKHRPAAIRLDQLDRENSSYPVIVHFALTHPSRNYVLHNNLGPNPDHVKDTLANCRIRNTVYGDRKQLFRPITKRGVSTLFKIMAKKAKTCEYILEITNYERLEFLGDALLEFLVSIHLFFLFPQFDEGRLSTFSVGLIQNHFFTSLARNLCLQHFIIYNHGQANSFEALMDAIYLDGGLVKKNKQLTNIWNNLQEYPLKVQYLNSDPHLIEQVPLLKQLTKFEQDLEVEFRHIRIDYLYRHFLEHHEGHLSLLRSCTVSNPTQAVIYDELGMQVYVDYVREQLRMTTPKLIEKSLKAKADVFEAFIAALFIDPSLESIYALCRATIFPHLQDFISTQH
ncbi:unnamed protein product, partial [Rotaria sp. Silwood1]